MVMDPGKKNQGIDDESLLRLAASAIHEQLEEKEKKEEQDFQEIVFTKEELQKKWKKLLWKFRWREFKDKFRLFLKKTMAAVAAVILAAGGTMVTAMAVSPTIREIVLTDFGKYSTLDMLISGGRVEVPDDWQGSYYPTYIPEGFDYKRTDIDTVMSSLIYENSEGMYLDFTIIIPDADADIGIDTENTTKTEIQIKGRDAILYEKKDRLISRVLINYEDCVIDIFGPVSSKEIIKIAEKIAIKK